MILTSSRDAAFFHHSTNATEKLKEIQKQQKFPEHKLIQSVETRWNTVFCVHVWETTWAKGSCYYCTLPSWKELTMLVWGRLFHGWSLHRCLETIWRSKKREIVWETCVCFKSDSPGCTTSEINCVSWGLRQEASCCAVSTVYEPFQKYWNIFWSWCQHLPGPKI